MSLALACATWMCASQARNHDLPAPGARARLALGPADRVPEPPRLRGALRRRAQPRRALGRHAGDRAARPRRLQARQRRARARVRRRAAALGGGDDERRGAPIGRHRPPGRRRVRGPRAGRRRAAEATHARRAPAGRAGRQGAGLLRRSRPTRGTASTATSLHQQADLALYAVKHGRAAPQAPRRRHARAELGRRPGPRRRRPHGRRPRALGRRRRPRRAHRRRPRLGPRAPGAPAPGGHAPRRRQDRRPGGDPAQARGGSPTTRWRSCARTPTPAPRSRRRSRAWRTIAPWIRHSHEHVDGSGYPLGLRGEDIPLESRILLVADAFDAMTSDRAYRAAMPVADALAELRRCAGRQFDARCVELLAQALRERAGALDHVVELRLTRRPRPRRRARSAASSPARSAAPGR